MNPQDYQAAAENLTLANAAAQNTTESHKHQQFYMQEENKSIAEMQLEVESILDKCYHLLRQDKLKMVNKMPAWVDLEDSKKRVLTDEGVDKIMQTMAFYVNKENLLSNFDEDMIRRMIFTFRIALNGNMFMKYNQLFRQPTIEECRDILNDRLLEKKNIKMYAAEILNLKADEEKIEADILKEMENRIEKEIGNIREQKRKENLKEWELMFEQLSQIVFATLNRAWRGEERGSIRRHTQINEVRGQSQPDNNKRDGGFFSWGR